MLITIRVHLVGTPTAEMAIDPWQVLYIRPVYLEENTCYLSIGETTWRVDSSFEDLVKSINDARRENKYA